MTVPEQGRSSEGPRAWVTDDAVLFVVTSPYGDLVRAAEDGNEALAGQGYPEWLNARTVRPDYRSVLWVSPDVVEDEQWPDSCVSDTEVRGWVKLFRFELEEFDRG